MKLQKVFVKFDSAEQIVNFVNEVSKCDADMDLGPDKYDRVNAKSLLGVFTLDFNRPLYVRFDSRDEELKNKISPFMCKKEMRCSCL